MHNKPACVLEEPEPYDRGEDWFAGWWKEDVNQRTEVDAGTLILEKYKGTVGGFMMQRRWSRKKKYSLTLRTGLITDQNGKEAWTQELVYARSNTKLKIIAAIPYVVELLRITHSNNGNEVQEANQ